MPLRQEANPGLHTLFVQPRFYVSSEAISSLQAFPILNWQGSAKMPMNLVSNHRAMLLHDYMVAHFALSLIEQHKTRFPHLAFNLCLTSAFLQDEEFPRFLLHELEHRAIETDQLRLEFPISPDLDKHRIPRINLGVLSSDGIGITGIISHLQQDHGLLANLPTNTVKLDRRLTSRLSTQAIGQIESLVHAFHDNGYTLIADGVETRYQLKQLSKMKVEEVQGNLLAAAVPAHQLAYDLLQIPANPVTLQKDLMIHDRRPE